MKLPKIKFPKFESKKQKHEKFLIQEFENGNVIRLENKKETHKYSTKFNKGTK